ncbi:MAG: S41 family peptidase [Planctomycetes bacterium]|nr:S41 family peptidase [Planctomycetota bacterium]
MTPVRWFAGWILPIGATVAILAGTRFPLLGGEPEDVAKGEKKLKLIHDLVKSGYVEEPDSDKLYDGAARGMLGSLDSHCQYYDVEEMKEFLLDTEGHYGGIGVQLEFNNDSLEIVATFEDTPAFNAGLIAGDRIIKIGELTTEAMTSGDAAKYIRGNAGTPVKLTVLRKSTGKVEEISLTRAEIVIASVKGKTMVNEKEKVGYVRLLQFQEDSWEKFRVAVDALRDKGMKALIIDLRFNGGGLLTQSVKIADLFIDSGVIVETKGRLKSANEKYEARKDDTYPEFPVVVLVNEGSASASEILSGALQDHKRAMLVGSKTYGKGSVQQYLRDELGDGTGLKFTIARYFTPNGRWIDRKAGKDFGLEPDIVVDLTPEETSKLMEHWRKLDLGEKDEAFKDRQLEQAVATAITMLRVGERQK